MVGRIRSVMMSPERLTYAILAPSGLIRGSLATSSEKRSRASRVRDGPSGAAADAGKPRARRRMAASERRIMNGPLGWIICLWRSPGLAERRHRLKLGDLAHHRRPLGLEIGPDRVTKSRVGDVVGRPGRHRPIAAAQLVRTLRACLDSRQSATDRRLDRLIVADF